MQSITTKHLQKYWERTVECFIIFEGKAKMPDGFLIVYTFVSHLQGRNLN
jgi:hypothetical protein